MGANKYCPTPAGASQGSALSDARHCPDCGTNLVSEPGIPGLCPQCLLSLALKESPRSPAASAEGEASEADAVATLDRLSAGRILGERYQIRELLGRGGMGEVFRAFDLKLRVDVALKAVRAERVESEHGREQLRQEVRSAREVVSPNVCRIFDLVAEDGQELVSMEFIDGTTLGDTLKERLPGFETRRPYPGLSSFTEADAEYFFGRELEVEALWKKLKRPRLLALVAPSGAGKSSFLRAGLLPALPKGWKALLTTPGSRPFQSLARALAPAFAGDGAAFEALLRFEDEDAAVSLLQRFRQRHDDALVVLDQFEELFTLSPRDVQDAFTHLLGRLVLDADLHVVLSLRDDFLLQCHGHEALAPAFSDLTPLGPLSESSLRRALVQPALSCGYKFEDEALVGEMVAAVKGERGALPLLAFAAWPRCGRTRTCAP